MFIIKILLVALVQLLLGDLLSTFVYHVPEHIFGKFHAIVHHSKNRSFIHYAVLTKNPLVLLDRARRCLSLFDVCALVMANFSSRNYLGTSLG